MVPKYHHRRTSGRKNLHLNTQSHTTQYTFGRVQHQPAPPPQCFITLNITSRTLTITQQVATIFTTRQPLAITLLQVIPTIWLVNQEAVFPQHQNPTNTTDAHHHNGTHFNGTNPFSSHSHNGTHFNGTNSFGAHTHNDTHFNGTGPFGPHDHNSTHFNGSNPYEHHNASSSNHSHPFGHEVRSITQHSTGAPALKPDLLFLWMLILCMLCSWISDQIGSTSDSPQTGKQEPRHHVLDYMSASASLERPATFDEFCFQSGLEPTAEEKPMLQSSFDCMPSSLHGHMLE